MPAGMLTCVQHMPYTLHMYTFTHNTPNIRHTHTAYMPLPHSCTHIHRCTCTHHTPMLHAPTYYTHTYRLKPHITHRCTHPHPPKNSFTWAGALREHCLLACLELWHLQLIPLSSFFYLEWLETWKVFPEKKMKNSFFLLLQHYLEEAS